MQLNRQTDYALRVLMFVAMKPEGSLSTLNEISQQFNIVRNHLSKIVMQLSSLGLVITQRGNGGGVKIHPGAFESTLFDIVRHFEPTFKSIDCEGLDCPISGCCRLEMILSEASGAYISVLQKYCLKDILPRFGKAEYRVVFERLGLTVGSEST